MSRYTIQLRDVVNLLGMDEVLSWFKSYDEAEFLTIDELNVIKERGTWSKDRLAEKIVNHYWTYEIGYETPALFAHQVQVQMNEMMEEYMPLIYSASIKFDPLVNVDFTETFHQEDSGNATNAGTSKSTSNSSGGGLSINSDTPQGQISKSDILKGKYASSTGANETENKVTDETNTNGNQEYTKTIKGNSGVTATAKALIKQYRDIIRAIDTEIVYELEPLFMGLY